LNSEGKISVFEAICITTFIITTKIFFTSPSYLVKHAGTASWYCTIISCITSIIFFLLIYLLMKRFIGKNIVEIFEIVLGKYFGKLLSLLFCAYGLYYSGSNLREFVEMIKAYNLPYSPPSVIFSIFIATVCLITYFGLNGISRISVIYFYPVIAGFILILLLASPNYDVDYLKPYLGYGLGNSLTIGFLRSSAYEEVFILTIIINSMQSIKAFKKSGIISLIIAGIAFSISLICYLMTFGYIMGSENLSGIFQLSKIIYFNRFFQRLESVFLFIWVISSVIAASISFYITIIIYCKTFNIQEHKPLILPFAALLFLVAILPNSLSEVIDINLVLIRQYSLFLVYFIPVLVLLLSLILKKNGGKANVYKT
jgi:spore germination protein KB